MTVSKIYTKILTQKQKGLKDESTSPKREQIANCTIPSGLKYIDWKYSKLLFGNLGIQILPDFQISKISKKTLPEVQRTHGIDSTS